MLDCNLCDIKMKRRLRETYTTNRPCKLLDNEQKVLFYQNPVSSLNFFLPVGWTKRQFSDLDHWTSLQRYILQMHRYI